MPVYDADGNALINVYDADGNSLIYAYDADGNVVFQNDNKIRLTVMEYNAGQWYVGDGTGVPANYDDKYYSLQNGMIKKAKADILLICEYLDNMSGLPRTATSMLEQYYPYIQTQNGGSAGYYGRAICSKYPLNNWTQHAYRNDNNRYYDTADITVDGNQITLVITHLSPNDNRVAQLGELIRYLSTLDSFICAGDMNTLTFNGSATTEADDYTNVIEPLLNAGFHLANCSDQRFLITYSAQPTGTYVGCLDNIITSSNITIESVSVDTTKLTDKIYDKIDHMPLIATIAIE